MTENGHVARGVCETDENGHLVGICERTRIEKHGEQAEYTEDDGKTWTALPNDSIVSMNMWGFTPSMLTELKNRFPKFLEENLENNPLKCEFLGHQVLFRQDSQHPGDGGAGHLEDPGHLGGADRRLSLGQLANGQQIPQMRLAQFHEMERLLPPGGAGLPLVRNDGYFRSGIRRRPRSRRRRSSRPFRDAGCRCPCLRWPQRPPGR